MSQLDELANNARRLLADAELVFREGSHQTAMSVAILALEEVGKFFQLKWEDKDRAAPRRGAQAHRMKQATVGSFYAAEASYRAVQEFMGTMGFEGDEASMRRFLLSIDNADEETLINFMADKMATDEKSRVMTLAQQGVIDRIKQQGLYVDIDSDGNIHSSPSSITHDIAVEWMEHARRAVARLPK